MLNLADVLNVSDFEPGELQTVKEHIENSSDISFENMSDAWRDANGTLCISYSTGRWYHYNKNGEWW